MRGRVIVAVSLSAILLVNLAVCLVACFGAQALGSKNNNANILMNGGYELAQGGEWIYYFGKDSALVLPNSEEAFYKIRSDGTGKTKVRDLDVMIYSDGSEHLHWSRESFNVIGDWIYYWGYEYENGSYIYSSIGAYKIKTDGSKTIRLNENEIERGHNTRHHFGDTMYILGDYAYTVGGGWSEDTSFYKIPLKGGEAESFALPDDKSFEAFYVSDDGRVYYGSKIYDYDENGEPVKNKYGSNEYHYGIFRMDLNGRNDELILENANPQKILERDGYIYFMEYLPAPDGDDYNYVLCKAPADGSAELVSLGVRPLSWGSGCASGTTYWVEKGWIYYGLEDGFYKMKTDGTGQVKVFEYEKAREHSTAAIIDDKYRASMNLNIFGDYIYFYDIFYDDVNLDYRYWREGDEIVQHPEDGLFPVMYTGLYKVSVNGGKKTLVDSWRSGGVYNPQYTEMYGQPSEEAE